MSAVVLSLTDRQPDDVQRRAALACARQDHALRQRPTLDELLGHSFERGIIIYPTLDAWYRSLPVPAGRLGPKITMPADVKRHYGLLGSTRLFELRGLGGEVDHWRVVDLPVAGGRVVGVKAPMGGGGVGVLWGKEWRARAYALRLSSDHGLPVRECWG